MRVHLFVDAPVTVMYIHIGAPKSFQLYIGMYIVLSPSTKSMTLTLTDVGSQNFFKMELWAERLVEFW